MNKKLLAILLSLAVMMSMCFAGTAAVFAGDEPDAGAVLLDEGDVPEELADAAEPVEIEAEPAQDDAEDFNLEQANVGVSNYGSIAPTNINNGIADWYETPISSSSSTFNCYVEMPSAGTLFLTTIAYKEPTQNDVEPTVYGAKHSDTVILDNGDCVRTYIVTDAQSVQVSFRLYANEIGGILARYAPNTANTITAPVDKNKVKTYFHGGTGTTSTTTKFKVKVNYPGYIALDIADDSDSAYSVQVKTSGFKDYEYLTSKDIRRYIGVKKGTYTFTVKSFSPVYKIKVRLYKVSQSKYGTSKKKAATIKAKKTYKGLIVTNAKKVHWYKFKNTKLHKVTVTIKGKANDGGSYGAYKITLYDKKGSIGSSYFYGDTASKTLNPYTIGKGSKLVKGTYWIKVESYKGGNGYFTIKWK